LTSNKLWWSAEIFHIFEIDPNRFDASYEAFLAAIHPDDRGLKSAWLFRPASAPRGAGRPYFTKTSRSI